MLSKDGKENFTLNIIDTPGFREFKSQQQQIRSDEIIGNLIITLIRLEITKLHTVILCCSPTIGVSSDDIKVMEEVYEMFGDEIKIIVCITRAEELGKSSREKKIKELKENDRMKKILEKSPTVFFSGAIDINKTHQDKIDEVASRVYIDRENIVNFIHFNKSFIELKKLAFVKKEIRKSFYKS